MVTARGHSLISVSGETRAIEVAIVTALSEFEKGSPEDAKAQPRDALAHVYTLRRSFGLDG